MNAKDVQKHKGIEISQAAGLRCGFCCVRNFVPIIQKCQA